MKPKYNLTRWLILLNSVIAFPWGVVGAAPVSEESRVASMEAVRSVIVVFKDTNANPVDSENAPASPASAPAVAPGAAFSSPAVGKLKKTLEKHLVLPAEAQAAPGIGNQGKAKKRRPASDRKRAERAVRRLNNMYRADVAEGVSLAEAIKTLQADERIEYVEPNYPQHLFAKPNDAHFDEVWGMNNTGQGFYAFNNPPNWRAPQTDEPQETRERWDRDMDWLEAWNATPGTDGYAFPTGDVLVCVIDTGVAYTHPDLAENMWFNAGEDTDADGILQWNATEAKWEIDPDDINGIDDDQNGHKDDFFGIDALNGDADPWDDHGHGTHCAGTIAAIANNHIGIVGVNPHAKIMANKFLGAEGGDSNGAIACIQYAVDMGAKVLSNSWGGGPYSVALQDAIDYANAQGAIFVAAAGNSNTKVPSYPSAYKGVIAVAASSSWDMRADFTNYGSHVDVSAPGVDILSLRSPDLNQFIHPGDASLAVMSGTSMACPNVSGVVSLLVAQNPGRHPAVYENALKASTDPIYHIGNNADYTGWLGTGRVNIPAALNFAGDSVTMETWIVDKTGTGSVISVPSEEFEITATFATYSAGHEGVSLRLTGASGGLTLLGQTEYVVGSVAAYSQTTLPENIFNVKIKDDAEWGSVQQVTIELRDASGTIASKTLKIPLYSQKISNLTTQDIDGDGFKELIGNSSEVLFILDEKGAYKYHWKLDIPVIPLNTFFGENMVGEFDGNPANGKEVGVITGFLFGGVQIEFYRRDPDTDSWSHWKNLLSDVIVGYSDWALVDVDGNGTDDIVFSGTQTGGNNPRMIAVDVANSTYDEPTDESVTSLIWSYNSAYGANDFNSFAITDGDGDGELDVMLVETVQENTPNTLRLHLLDLATGTLKFRHDLGAMKVLDMVAGDFDGDGSADAFLNIEMNGDNFSTIVSSVTGATLPGWPKRIGIDLVSPAIADLDLDGDLEIIAVSEFPEYTYQVKVYHHDGSFMQGFPVRDLRIARMESCAVGDIDGDGFPDVLYSRQPTPNGDGTETYEIVALDRFGYLLHGFPIQVKQLHSREYTSSVANRIILETLSPPFIQGEKPEVTILSTMLGSQFNFSPTGYRWDDRVNSWKSPDGDWNSRKAHKRTYVDLRARLTLQNVIGYGSLVPQFHVNIEGGSTEGIVYRWDFNNDGDFDDPNEGVGPSTPSHTFTNSASVRLVISNAVGQSYEIVVPGAVTVYPSPLQADFTAPFTSGKQPLGVAFADASQNGVVAWAWDFDNDGDIDSTERNPEWIYTKPGNYTVSLTVSNALGNSVTETKTDFVTVNPDGIFTSPSGNAWQTASADSASNFRAVAAKADGSVYAAAGRESVLARSEDGHDWTRLSEGDLLDVIYAGSKYVAIGESGTLKTSPDGKTWTYRTTGVDVALRSVAYKSSAPSGYLAVGDNGTILTSPDGAVWTPQTSGTQEHLRGVVFFAGATSPVWVAVGDRGTVLTSPDGVAWTPRNSQTSDRLNAVTMGGAWIFAVGDNGTLVYASNGVSAWTASKTPFHYHLKDVAFTGTDYFIVGDKGICYRSTSPNGTWTNASTGLNDYLCIIAKSQTEYILGTQKGMYATFQRHSSLTLLQVESPATSAIYSLAWKTPGGEFIAVGEKGMTLVGTMELSNDLYTYDHEVVHSGDTLGMDEHNGTFWASQTLGTLQSSTDGLTWTSHSTGQTENIRGVLDNGSGRLVAYGDQGTLLSSGDAGTTWTQALVDNLDFDLHGGIYADGQFLLAADGGRYLTSSNGLDWVVSSIGRTNHLYGVGWNGLTGASKKLFLYGNKGILLQSSTATTWEPVHTGTSFDLYRMALKGTSLFLSGQGGTLLSASQDGTAWTAQTTGTSKDLRGLATPASGEIVATGIATTIYVALDGSDRFPYSSWEFATPHLQYAIDRASPGDSVLVKAGTYKAGRIDDSRVATFTRPYVSLRSWSGASHTILDGESARGVIGIDTPLNANTGFAQGKIEIDGFTIRGGASMIGAGLYASNGYNSSVRNCIFTQNQQTDGAVFVGAGAAIAVGSTGSSVFLHVEDCEIFDNHADQVCGGIASGDYGNQANFIANRCRIFNNSANRGASAVSGGTVKNSLIHGNTGGEWVIGWNYFMADGEVFIDNCTVANNNCATGSDSWTSNSAVLNVHRVRNSVFWNNTSRKGFWAAKYATFNANFAVVFENINNADRVVENSYIPSIAPAGFTQSACIVSTANPGFIGAFPNDYRLGPSSPCRGSGLFWEEYRYEAGDKFYFDFGNAGTTTAGAWNNITSTSAQTFSPVVNSDGNTVTGLSLVLDESWNQIVTGGEAHNLAPDEAVNHPLSAQTDAFLATGADIVRTLRFKGVSPHDRFTVRVMASATSTYQFYGANYAVHGSPTYYLSYNPSNRYFGNRLFETVSPIQNGGDHEIVIYAHNDNDFAFDAQAGGANDNGVTLSALQIDVLAAIPKASPILITTDLGGYPRSYNGTTVDMGAYEYQGSLTPVAAVSIGGSGEQRVQQTVVFDASASFDTDGTIGADKYFWDWNNDGFIDEAGLDDAVNKTKNHLWTTAGWKTLRLVVEDNSGLTHETLLSFEVLPAVPDSASALGGSALVSEPDVAVSLNWTDNAANETGYRVFRRTEHFEPIVVITDDADTSSILYIAEDFEHNDIFYRSDWFVATDPDAYNGSYHYLDFDDMPDGTNHPNGDVVISLNAPETGNYEVFVRWPDASPWPVTRNTDFNTWSQVQTFNIRASNQDLRLNKNLTQNANQWNSLGVFALDSVSSIKIDSAYSRGLLAFDAVKIVKIEPFVEIATLGANATSFTDNGTTDGKTYSYKVVAFNADGSAKESNIFSVSVPYFNNAPTATITGVSALMGFVPKTISVTGSASDDRDAPSALHYRWDFGDGYTGSVQQGINRTEASYNYRYAGDYTITLTVTDLGGFSHTVQSDVVTILPPDFQSPQLLGVTSDGSGDLVLLFDEAMEQTSAENAAHYTLNKGATVISASRSATEPNKVTLATSGLVNGNHTLTVSGVKDLAGNAINLAQVSFNFVAIETITFQDGASPTAAYAGTQDTYVWSGLTARGTYAYMEWRSFTAGKGLIRFDLSAIPQDATIVSATLELTQQDAETGGPYTLALYEALKPWVESTATDTKYDGTNPWSPLTNGADSINSVTPLSDGVTTPDTANTTMQLPINPAGMAKVQNWVNGSLVNNGFFIVNTHSSGTRMKFYSSESSTAAYRPKLTVRYSLPAANAFEEWLATNNLTGPGALDAADPDRDGLPNLVEFALGGDPNDPQSAATPGIDTDGGHLTLAFTPARTAGLRFIVEASPDLADWSDVQDITASLTAGQPHVHTDPANLATTPRRFLRLRITR